MSQPFSFPPPPPPPPKRDSFGYSQPSYPSQQSFRGRGNPFNHSRDQIRGRGRGNAHGYNGAGRGGFFNGPANYNSYSHNSERLNPPVPDFSSSYNRSARRGAFQARGNKRPFDKAFSGPRHPPQSPTAVPSFNAGITLFSTDTAALSSPSPLTLSSTTVVREPRKPRSTNLLGLTPAGVDNASSEDEAAVDEEATFATIHKSALHVFEHRGKSLTLNTPAEIAAWIAERKRRFPTTAQAEAAKKADAERRARIAQEREEKRMQYEIQKADRKKRQDEERTEKRRKWEEREAEKTRKLEEHNFRKDQLTHSPRPSKAQKLTAKAEQARLKAERLMAKAKREQEKLQDRRPKIEAPQMKPVQEEGVDAAIAAIDAVANLKHELLSEEIDIEAVSSSEDSDACSEDDTSSSGSSNEDSDSELSDSSSASSPEELSTKAEGPIRVPAPRRTAPVSACKNLLKFGYCRFENTCRFNHDPSAVALEKEKLAAKRELKRRGQEPEMRKRKSLYEVMVEKEKEEARKVLLQGIIALGEQGMLDEPAS